MSASQAAIFESGTVKMYDAERGFGFIKPDNLALDDCFVHSSILRDAGIERLERGDRVRFVRVSDKRGFRAVRVEVLW